MVWISSASAMRAALRPAAISAPRLRLLGQHKALAIRSTQQPIRLGVANNTLGLGVKAQRVAGAEGDVAEMAQAGALVTLFDVGIRTATVANAVDEVLEVGAF